MIDGGHICDDCGKYYQFRHTSEECISILKREVENSKAIIGGLTIELTKYKKESQNG